MNQLLGKAAAKETSILGCTSFQGRAIWRWRCRSHVRFLPIGLLLTLGALAAIPAPAKERSSGLQLFETLMPVFRHPRCINCHGGVNAVTGDDHAGGRITEAEPYPDGDGKLKNPDVCAACHTARAQTNEPGEEVWDEKKGGVRLVTKREFYDSRWRPAPGIFTFVGVDTLTLCERMRLMGDNLLVHVDKSIDIELGFEGRRGIDERSPFGPVDAEPPPMSKAEFLAAARRWVEQGKMACELSIKTRGKATIGAQGAVIVQTFTGVGGLRIQENGSFEASLPLSVDANAHVGSCAVRASGSPLLILRGHHKPGSLRFEWMQPTEHALEFVCPGGGRGTGPGTLGLEGSMQLELPIEDGASVSVPLPPAWPSQMDWEMMLELSC